MFLGSERRLTDALAEFFDDPRVPVEVGIGDDAAVLPTTDRTVVACDPVVEGVHFTREDPLELVGRKAVNRNLSDLAAMGAQPTYLVVSSLLPEDLSVAGRTELFGGIRTAARAAGCRVVGGDVCLVPQMLVITVTAIGTAPERPVCRDGLRVGDRLCLTGSLGGSRAGHHLTFEPRLAEGEWLAGQRGVTAMMDVSDGLLLDLATMLAASSKVVGRPLGAELVATDVPVTAAAQDQAANSGRRPLDHALSDGEDHELLFGVAEAAWPLPPSQLAGSDWQSFGCISERPGIRVTHADGTVETRPIEGYRHDV